MGVLALEEREHVGCRLAKVVVGGHFGEGDAVREPVNGEGVANAKGAWDVAFETAVVVKRGANVPAVNAMRCHAGALVSRHMDNDASSGRGERALIEVEISIEAGIGRELGLAARRAKEIECDVGLRHQKVPVGKRKLWVACCETRTEMIFPSLDRAFG